jgi:hypothetical protein
VSDKLFGKGGLFFGGDDRDLLDAASRYANLPSSPNIQSGTPLSWAEQDVLETRPEFTGPKQYPDLRTNYLYAHPPDPNSWANTHMPQNLPTTPMADPSMDDPSIVARQRTPLPAGGWGVRNFNYSPPYLNQPGMTLNSVPQ